MQKNVLTGFPFQYAQNQGKVPSMCLNVYTSIVYLSYCSLSLRSVKIRCLHCRYLLLIYRFELDENLLRMERFLSVVGATGASGVSEYDSITCRRPTGIPSKGTLRFSKHCVFNLSCLLNMVRNQLSSHRNQEGIIDFFSGILTKICFK